MDYARTQEVKVTKTPGDNMHDEVADHPAFGLAAVYRVQSTGYYLAGSDFRHHSMMKVELKAAQRARGLSQDRFHEREVIAEFFMSEAQWAAFVSSPNSGSGVPVTIRYRQRGPTELVPLLPAPASRLGQFDAEMRETFKDALSALDKVRAALKRKGQLTREMEIALEQVQNNVDANADFVAEQFGGHMEDTVERAKAEAEAYVASVVQRAGLRALGGEPAPPIELQGAPKALPHAGREA